MNIARSFGAGLLLVAAAALPACSNGADRTATTTTTSQTSQQMEASRQAAEAARAAQQAAQASQAAQQAAANAAMQRETMQRSDTMARTRMRK